MRATHKGLVPPQPRAVAVGSGDHGNWGAAAAAVLTNRMTTTVMMMMMMMMMRARRGRH